MRFFRLLLLTMAVSVAVVHAQPSSPTCVVTGVPTIVRSEGVTERLGDIVFNCTGASGSTVTGNLTLNLSVPIANRVTDNVADVLLTINTGAGAILAGASAQPLGNNQVVFSGLNFSFGATGNAELRITNLRGNASVAPSNITVQVAFDRTGLLSLTTSNLIIGVPQKGLLASAVSALVCSQIGSPLPETLGFTEFILAGSSYASVRLTEGFAFAFRGREAMTDTGVRFLVRYSNVPSDARLFVPDFIAGSDAAVPTAAGDYGGTISGGQYLAGSSTLLLARVANTDANGAGGFNTSTVPSGTPLNNVSELSVVNGVAFAIYEVIDSNQQAIESAQLPTFLAIPRSVNERNVEIRREVYLAPIASSTNLAVLQTIPRFAGSVPDNDCTIRGDCSKLIPRLAVPFADPLSFEVLTGAAIRGGRIYVENAGGGRLQYAARVEYKVGTQGWIRLTQETNSVYVLVQIPGLVPGTYQADVVIDAGSAGLQRIPVSLKINPTPAPPAPAVVKPAVTSLTNGATFSAGPVAVGSLVTLKGSNLSGTNLGVTFDGIPARLIYSSAEQINLQVPMDLGNRQITRVVVTANGVAGDALTINLSPIAPGIFVPGILNQDGTVNSASNPAQAGTFVQIFATGLLAADGTGTVEAKLHDQTYTSLPYAGPAPGISGVQQVNLMIPAYWPTMTTEVLLCSTAGGQRVCSPPVKISARP